MQESLYNLGRAMHQLSLLPQAIHYYKAALEAPPYVHPPPSAAAASDPTRPALPSMDLTKEIAFNLALIYKSSGSLNLAKMYISKYIVI